nr:MAG TPA: hypothetical protein [Caudoviricetes sp.]
MVCHREFDSLSITLKARTKSVRAIFISNREQ